MRKKTIEEELKEIQAEKDDHIAQLEKEFGHSKKHSYKFSSNENTIKDNTFEDSNPAEEKSSNRFTLEDYSRMIKLEESELSDEEFEEYSNLCDRFSDADNKDELEELYRAVSNQNTTSTIQPNTSTSFSQSTDDTPKFDNSPWKNIPIAAIAFLSIFVLAGLSVMIFAGIIPWAKYSNYVQVVARVEEVQNSWYDDGYQYKLLVSYEYDEKTYSQVITKEFGGTIQEGVTTFTILINPQNPTQLQVNTRRWYVFPTYFGIIFAGLALIMQTNLIIRSVKKKHQKG